jgi:hypothetical protein
MIAKIFLLVEYMNVSFDRTRISHRPEWKQNILD